jgi:hypothetical protein
MPLSKIRTVEEIFSSFKRPQTVLRFTWINLTTYWNGRKDFKEKIYLKYQQFLLFNPSHDEYFVEIINLSVGYITMGRYSAFLSIEPSQGEKWF